MAQVCRHWRDTALDCIALWSYISFADVKFAKFMLERSRNGPISIHCDSYALTSNVEMSLCRALSRPNTLSIDLQSRHFHPYPLRFGPLLSVIANWPSPVLETVICQDMPKERTVPLPAQFLRGTAPNLKCLTLIGIGIGTWSDVPLRPTLTRLNLHRRHSSAKVLNADSGSPSWSQLINALQDILALEELSLNGYMPNETWPVHLEHSSNGSALPIHLSKLRKLNLKGLRTSIEQFFEVTRFLDVTEAEFEIEDTQETSFICKFLKALGASWDDHCNEPVYHLQYCDSSSWDGHGPSYVFRFNPSIIKTGTPMLRLRFSTPTTPSESNDLMNAIQEDMDFSKLAMLDASDPEFTQETWVKSFGVLPKLKTIVVNSENIPVTFTQALRYHHYLRGTPLNFPALAVLRFDCQGINLREAASLVSALQTRPRSSPHLELGLYTDDHLDTSVFQYIVTTLAGATVNRGDGDEIYLV